MSLLFAVLVMGAGVSAQSAETTVAVSGEPAILASLELDQAVVLSDTVASGIRGENGDPPPPSGYGLSRRNLLFNRNHNNG